MPLYHFYRLNAAAQILAAAEYVDCSGDGMAHAIAASLIGDHAAVEIWAGTRLVGSTRREEIFD
jgi:hypothetical protein